MRTQRCILGAALTAAFILISANLLGSSDRQVIRIRLTSRTLEFFENGKLACFGEDRTICSFPIRIGTPETPTPLGEGYIYTKRDRPIFRYVDPGPKQGEILHEADCPNGNRNVDHRRMRALGIRIRGMRRYSIHSITCYETIGQAVSRGCIGMLIDDMLMLYPRVHVSAKVIITDD